MRRAGTHFLLHSLKNNFHINWYKWALLHIVPDIPTVVNFSMEHEMILIIRNPIDNLSSLYRFLKTNDNSKERPWDMTRTSFSTFLRGQTPHSEQMWDRWMKHCLKDPIGYWVDNSYLAEPLNRAFPVAGVTIDKIYTVKYEDLKSNFDATMKQIEDHYGFRRKSNGWVRPPKVGPSGTGNKPVWSDKDLELLEQKAGKRMKMFGYEV